MNHVILAGNLTRDPESRQLPSGTAVADLGLAINDSYKNKSGELVETTCFVDVVVWGRLAETCSQYLRKGSPVLVEGRLQLDQWTTQEGEKRSKLRVRADRVQFLGGKRAEGAEGGGGGGGGGSSGAPRSKPAGGGEEHADETPF
jgi:single-strand DNA-binding protein